VPLYDIDGTASGVATVHGSLAVLTSLIETIGGSGVAGAPVSLDHIITDPIMGSSDVFASTQAVFNMSGFIIGSGDLIDARLMNLAGIAAGSCILSGDLRRLIGVSGYTQGFSALNLSVPEPIYGVAIVTAYMDVVHVPLPICEIPTVSTAFRWGHVFTWGDLELSLKDRLGNPFGPVSISYTLYQMQRGCALKQIGPSRRTPASSKVGCYYVTGTAGECGQPGLWAVRWCYQKTFSDSVIEKDCYFQVLDFVSCPIPGDTLVRACKYGWDEN